MAYVDGFVLAVPTAGLAEYKKFARKFGKVWREHGALSFVECVGEDTPYGELTSFPRAVLLKDDETVVFSWVTYKSRKHRDAVMNKVMEDPRLQPMMQPGAAPFDGKRMIFGGFTTMLSL